MGQISAPSFLWGHQSSGQNITCHQDDVDEKDRDITDIQKCFHNIHNHIFKKKNGHD